MGLLDLAVLDDEGVALAADAAEDGGGVKGQVEGFGELGGWVAEEADLDGLVSTDWSSLLYETYAGLLGGIELIAPPFHAMYAP